MKKPQVPETYDSQYAAGGHARIYHLPHWRSPYLPLFKTALSELKQRRVSHVLDVGCGNGRFAHILLTRSDLSYSGFDFSQVAVEMARQYTGRAELFQVGDALRPESYDRHYDAIVCLEVLEHLPTDRQMVGLWRTGATCICSVPNFDSSYHVRHFTGADQVEDRYVDLIDIDKIIYIPCPLASDLSLRARSRLVYEFVRRPGRLVRVCKDRASGNAHGWYVFSGTKR